MLTKQQKLYIASRGNHIEELIIEADPPIIAGLISKGLATEHNDEWKTSEHPEIRQALAQNGYYPDLFITDDKPFVREAVIEKYPDYCEQLLALNSPEHWEFVRKQINETTDLKYVKTFLDAPVPDKIDQIKLQAIHTMYEAKTSQPNPIEKTMSPLQLFQINSPFWANNLTLKRIESILKLYDNIKKDIFLENLNKLIELTENKVYLLIWTLELNHEKET